MLPQQYEMLEYYQSLCFNIHRIEPDNEYYDGEKDQDKDGTTVDS